MQLAAERSLYVVVIGGGAAGAEIAMALQHRFGERARLSLVTGGGPPLATHLPEVQQRVQRALRRLKITEFDEACAEVTASHVVLASGVRLACEAPVIAIGTSAPKWLAASGLALDEQGYILTGPTLQSTSHANVFAAGDVASRIDMPHPKSGVYAVRAGRAAGAEPAALRRRRRAAAFICRRPHPSIWCLAESAMPLRRGADYPSRVRGCGTGRTTSTALSSRGCASSRRAGRRAAHPHVRSRSGSMPGTARGDTIMLGGALDSNE